MPKSALVLAGSFTFAFLMGEMVHELGHYLCHLSYASPDVRIHLDPFGGSRIVGVGPLPLHVLGATSASGAALNLTLGIACLSLLWTIRRPILLPLLLWGPVAMVQEAVTFSLGMLTPGGDARWMLSWGVPQAALIGGSALLLMAGIGTMALLLPQANLDPADPLSERFAIVTLGICALMLIRFAFSVSSPDSALENAAPLVLSVLLSGMAVLAHQLIASVAAAAPGMGTRSVAWSEVALAVVLGTGMFWFQAIALN